MQVACICIAEKQRAGTGSQPVPSDQLPEGFDMLSDCRRLRINTIIIRLSTECPRIRRGVVLTIMGDQRKIKRSEGLLYSTATPDHCPKAGKKRSHDRPELLAALSCSVQTSISVRPRSCNCRCVRIPSYMEHLEWILYGRLHV